MEALNIDTAKYQLNKDTLAFGIRYYQKNSSRLYPYESTALNLYTYKNNKIKNILSKLIVAEYSGEYDGNCEGIFSDIKRIIMMGKVNKATGMAALRIRTQNETQENTVLPNGEWRMANANTKPLLTNLPSPKSILITSRT